MKHKRVRVLPHTCTLVPSGLEPVEITWAPLGLQAEDRRPEEAAKIMQHPPHGRAGTAGAGCRRDLVDQELFFADRCKRS